MSTEGVSRIAAGGCTDPDGNLNVLAGNSILPLDANGRWDPNGDGVGGLRGFIEQMLQNFEQQGVVTTGFGNLLNGICQAFGVKQEKIASLSPETGKPVQAIAAPAATAGAPGITTTAPPIAPPTAPSAGMSMTPGQWA